jgi:vacuolar-type H+-ATPase subunit E/Vma4
MAATVAKMTKHELKEIIESTVEKKLRELLGDPDQGLVLKKAIKARLLKQQKAVVAGERGESLASVVKRLGLN